MSEDKPQGKPETAVNPGVVEQLEQIKKSVPDVSQRLFDFLSTNLKPILLGCAGLLLAVGIYEGVSYWRAKEATKAADALGVLLIEKIEPGARIAALEDFLKTAPGGLKPTVQMELAAAAMIGQQYDKAMAAWTELEGSSSPDLRIIASIGRAKCLMLQNKPQDALTLLEALKAKAPEAYAQAITRQLAVAAEQAGKADVASAAYTELAGKGEGAAKPFFEFKANQTKPKS